jgi:glycosyltransferase involved in cell wall biosynthesis
MISESSPTSSTVRPRKLLYVVNNPAFFMSHRLPLACAAQAAGFDVHVATMAGDAAREIEAHGMTHHVIPMTRSGHNPFQELATLWALRRLFVAIKPDVVHLVTIKPVLYGGIAARMAGVRGVVAAISGLGFIFTRSGARARLVRSVVARLYRLALGHRNSRVIFQNTSDRDTLKNLGAVRADQIVIIRGSGVDLDTYRYAPEPSLPIIVTMASRLLIDKGVLEFVMAARILRKRKSGIRMQLAGTPDMGNPASVLPDDVEDWQRDGAVICLGEREDVAELYRQSHIVALPSYREGMPKSLLEAAASGRAVVTTDVPGCRDAIEPDITGLLVPVRDAEALAQAIERLAVNTDERLRFGIAGRALAEHEFDVCEVARTHVAIYNSLAGNGA